MRFWDTSAIVPLIIEQPSSRACRALRRSDPGVTVWALTRVEIASAIHRLVREGLLARDEARTALGRADAMLARFAEVVALEAVRERARRALAVHALTAADALQLAAALTLVADRPRRRGFVTADERLADAAAAEGFDAIVPVEK
jgi:uncharacterized protein